MDEDLEPELTHKVKTIAAEVPGAINVMKCHTRKMGVMHHAHLHIGVNRNLSVEEGRVLPHEVRDEIQNILPHFIDVMIHIEPAK